MSDHSHHPETSCGTAHEVGLEHSHKSHEHSLLQEIICHLPYAAFSLAFGFILLSCFHFIGLGFRVDERTLRGGYHLLFHSFHYLHLVFATVGTMVTFSRFSSNIGRGLFISAFSPAIFCTLSDVALPTFAAKLLGVSMHMHICFFNMHDLINVVPFLIVGLITGYAISRHHESALIFFSLGSHFTHILISSMASIFYIVSYGFDTWYSYMGLLFILLIGAVVVPCTVSDVVVPFYFARVRRKKNEKHQN